MITMSANRKPRKPRRRSANVDWSQIDWSRPTVEIANSVGVGLPTVSKARRRLAPDTLHQTPKWESVDWSQPNRIIAKQLGVPYSSVVSARGRVARDTVQDTLPRGSGHVTVQISSQAADMARAMAKQRGMSINRWLTDLVLAQ